MFQLPEELIINNISTLYQSFIALLEEGDDIEIDINQVIQADTASIQLLCALQKHLHSTEHKIQWHGKSDALIASAKTLGVLTFLEIEQA
ncbi:STAS domain-containing protein [Pseudoalteromonas denitrificans]|jgi:ABC-type transporter Mla MlaB component|uniref:STAS domain-containing protein n=1 Tax=Pseudoalteromonas denitrificans DSM 6059 TaxID=1123010 RepID=A0A1I1RNS6_9GAMM|nr:STAS domain-containing protein [Pseudoalteromonas denitrificans]SFD35994.1 STAS domain-containing protein [Pseudoalteromonas denitrificans DSM 6059]